MQLNNLVIDLSPKTNWQCFDLGCKVALADYKTLFGYWIVLTLPIFILLIALDIQWGLLVFWLLKPWYERGLLYILSRTVFGKKVSIAKALRALPSQIKPMWFSSITFRRLAPSRSFDMAVAQLENLDGRRRAKRLKVLHMSKDDKTSWWTICCVHWESFLAFAIITLIQILLPAKFDFWIFVDALSVADSLNSYILTVCVFLSMAMVAPIYVAGGFIAYLNRRVILEAWDIELGFTKWQKSYVEKTSKKAVSRQSTHLQEKTSSVKDHLVLAFIFVMSTGFLLTDTAYARTLASSSEKILTQLPIEASSISKIPPDNESYKQQEQEENDPFHAKKKAIRDDLESVLDEPPFAQRKIVTHYRLKLSGEDEKSTDEPTSSFALLSLVAVFIASSFEILLWILFVSLFAYIVYRNWGNIRSFFDTKLVETDNTPLPSFIDKAFIEESPDDIAFLVQQSIENKDYRRALSILLRASFTYLSKEEDIHLSKGMTENECLLEIKRTCSASIFLYMQSLLQQWMKMAWAHQLPNSEALYILAQEYFNTFIQAQNANETTIKSFDADTHKGSE